MNRQLNSANNQNTPLSYDLIESTPASGNYNQKKSKSTFLSPSPRSQLFEDPLSDIYIGKKKPFYKEILGNANFVRGNQFSNNYPFKKNKRFNKTILLPEEKNNHLGMVNDDPFYPFPSQDLLENKNYWSYPHEKKYLNDKPVYNYPYDLPEGTPNDIPGYNSYNPYLLEGFSNKNDNNSTIGIILLIFIGLLFGVLYYIHIKH